MARELIEETLRRIHIGTSGFSYPHWKGRFYPLDLPVRQQLGFYARHFATVELNGTFYRLPGSAAVSEWARAVPPGFVFAAKGSRYLTHLKRLRDPDESLTRFFEALAPLEGRLGPVLWQLSPMMKKDLPRLRDFLQALGGRPAQVLEFRRADWYCDEVFALVEEWGASLCLHDKLDEVKAPWPPPGPLYYRRFHGAGARYAGRYGRRGLRRAASEIAALARQGRPCFAFLNNDLDAAAIADALELQRLVLEALEVARERGAAPEI